jgi:hypothetical protein
VPVILWQCAHAEAPAVPLRCAPTVAIAPPDDSVDSNLVLIEGSGRITWFGDGPPILKRVMFSPQTCITLQHNPPSLSLLSCRDRTITAPAVGMYAADGAGHWSEVHFSGTGAAEISRRMDAIEQRIADLERRSSPAATPEDQS